MEAMDFMDPRRRLRHNVQLAIGYVLVAVVLLMITIILLFVAYGFGLKNGQVIQNGLVYVSSQPNPAQVYIDGVQNQNSTNARIVMPAGTYTFELTRTGYHNWSRTITVNGGQVQSYVYSLLIPNQLTTSTLQTYASAPALVTESDDQHWLLVSRPNSFAGFDQYDLNNPKQAPTAVDLPTDAITSASGDQTLQAIGWADDNNHLLLRHDYSGGSEYILLDRSSPDQSVNLTKAFNLPTAAVTVELLNNHSDRFVVWNSTTHELSTAATGTPTLKPELTNVLAFATYGDNDVLYVTPDLADSNKVAINIFDGSASYTVRRAHANTTYLLATANYNGDMYLALSAVSENIGYVYHNPLNQLTNKQLGVAVPAQVFTIKNPNYLSFSPNGEYAVIESGANVEAYDAENLENFNFTLADPVTAPQTHVAWLDSARLTYGVNGKAVVVDFSGDNRQTLVTADPRYPVAVDSNEKVLLTLRSGTTDKAQEVLTMTSLRSKADQ